MDKIIDAFRPFLDQTPTLDYVKTKLGWIMVYAEPLWVSAAHIPTEKDLLESLVSNFAGQVDGDHNSREDAQLAREAMAPYLSQLTPKQVQTVDLALELYAKLDDL